MKTKQPPPRNVQFVKDASFGGLSNGIQLETMKDTNFKEQVSIEIRMVHRLLVTPPFQRRVNAILGMSALVVVLLLVEMRRVRI